MPTTGLLRPDEVVFYHPLDNLTESTQSQAWTGTGGFVAGKIGLAESAITGDTPAWGTANASVTGGGGSAAGTVVKLDSTHAMVLTLLGGDARARVATVSGSDVTVGPNFVMGTGAAGGAQPRGALLSSGKVLVHWRDGTPIRMAVATVSGNDITFGPTAVAETGGIPGPSAPLSSTKCVMVYTGTGPHARAKVVEISGTSITVGASVQLSTASGSVFGMNVGVAALTSTRAVVTWGEGDGSETRTAVATVSGLGMTVGPYAVVVASVDTWDRLAVVALTPSRVVYAWTVSAVTSGRIADVSGTSFTFGPSVTLEGFVNYSGIDKLTSSRFIVCSRGSGTRRAKVCDVSGMSISVGAVALGGAISANRSGVAALSDATFMHLNSDLAAGVLSASADIEASTPGVYPAATGSDRVVVAMWAKDVTKGSSTIIVQRDYEVELTGTTVTLGPASAVWIGAAISDTLMGTDAGEMNDGDSHLLVLDFEHTGAGAWNLRTSVDGAAWVNQGAGTGTRSTAPGSATPKLAITNSESGQWIDELMMWSGDKTTFDIFTSEELANLYDLADTFGNGMNQYEENFGAPICWQATASMPDGSVWRDSGSGPCPPVVRVPRGASDIVITDDGVETHPRIHRG